MKLKIRLVIFVTAWTIFLSYPSLIFAATLSLNPNTQIFKKGCEYPVQVNLDTQGANTDGTDAILLYDPNKFSVSNSSIINGSAYNDYPGNSIDQVNGKISITGIAPVSQAFNGQGLFATINFKIKDNAVSGSTQIQFDFDPANPTNTSDSNVVERGTIVDVLSSVVDGNYTISDESCIAPPPDNDGDGWTNDQESFLGTDINDACPDNKRDPAWPPDFNNDKRVNQKDFVLLKRTIIRNKPYNKRYDLNMDNKLDNDDLNILIQNLNRTCSNK